MSFRKFILLVVAAAVSHVPAGQGDRKLQIHFMDVGQGDGAVLISPGGQVVLFDAGEDLNSARACTASTQHCSAEIVTRRQVR